jgi:HK97 family phage portal protein
MGVFDFFRREDPPAAQLRPAAAEPVLELEPAAAAVPEVQAAAGSTVSGHQFAGLDDPALLEYMRGGASTSSGANVNATRALMNMAVLRCMTLISESIGMLPLNLLSRDDKKEHLKDHPVYRLLRRKPNGWQTPYEFKSGMQLKVLTHGDAYARVVWSRGRPLQLIPLDPTRVTPRLGDDFQMVYRYQRPDGGWLDLPAREVLHLRDLSANDVSGLSRLKLAREAIGLALQTERAAATLFKNGMMASGALSAPGKLSPEVVGRLKTSMSEQYSGAENAHRWMVLEEGLKPEKWATTATDAQHIENRNHQIEEIARAFGVPRPLLMMDDTSWGSGMETLGIFFVQYSLQHWFTVWEEGVARTLLSEEEMDDMQPKFNERALMRGTLKDQGEFFTKALGAGGQAPFMAQNEVRDLLDMPRSNDPAADQLRNPMTQKPPGADPRKPDEPPVPA